MLFSLKTIVELGNTLEYLHHTTLTCPACQLWRVQNTETLSSEYNRHSAFISLFFNEKNQSSSNQQFWFYN